MGSMQALDSRAYWWHWIGLIVAPLAVMATAILLVWAPRGGHGDSALGLVWPYAVALGAGALFARRVVWGSPLVRGVLLLAYVIVGVFVLSWFILAINCGVRGVCP
jgi:hypothetical protein